MTVTGNSQSVREGIAFLHENLVTNTTPGGIEVNTMLPRELFNRSIFSKVLWGLVLNVVVEGKDRLFRVVNFGSTD